MGRKKALNTFLPLMLEEKDKDKCNYMIMEDVRQRCQHLHHGSLDSYNSVNRQATNDVIEPNCIFRKL